MVMMMLLLLLVVVRRRRRKTTTFTWILTTRSRFERCTWCEPRSIITKTRRNRLATPFSTVKASCLFLTAASQHETLGLHKRKNSISPTASSHARTRLADWPYRHNHLAGQFHTVAATSMWMCFQCYLSFSKPESF